MCSQKHIPDLGMAQAANITNVAVAMDGGGGGD